MRVNKIISNKSFSHKLHNHSLKHNARTAATHPQALTLPMYASPVFNLSKPYRTISFMGKTVHIVDGGCHATNMEHFAHAISDEMNTKMHNVETNSKDDNIKQLQSLEANLKDLANEQVSGTYIAVPALATVPILNMQDQYNVIMDDNKKFTAENLKDNKENLLKFLKKIYDYPEKYSKYINYMDPMKQGIQYTYGVIKQINKLVEAGANVYVPSGHPHEQTLKWVADTEDLKPELYHYIATGDDPNNTVKNALDDIKEKNWYDFNLLALSDAHVVGVRGVDDMSDYIFAAYDGFVTEKERGVYNFSPIRKADKIVGYSYTDTVNNQYPLSHFPHNDRIANIEKYVGKNYKELLATRSEIEELKDARKNEQNTKQCADKLYPIKEIFSDDEIKSRRYNLRGKYVDRSLTLFFDTNRKGEVIFPKCDCEGTGKPSVLSMWGSCFAVFNAIQRDILKTQRDVNEKWIDEHNASMQKDIKTAYEFVQSSKYNAAEALLKLAREKDMSFAKKHPEYIRCYKPDELLGDIYHAQEKDYWAKACYNNALDIIAKQIMTEIRDVPKFQQESMKYGNTMLKSENYDFLLKAYNSKPAFIRAFTSPPNKPSDYNEHKSMTKIKKQRDVLDAASDIFDKIANICENTGEKYPAKVCRAAALDICKKTDRGFKVLAKRVGHEQYIGDLYNEIKPD